jgi:hypothetical protein
MPGHLVHFGNQTVSFQFFSHLETKEISLRMNKRMLLLFYVLHCLEKSRFALKRADFAHPQQLRRLKKELIED